uniref:decapping and exoribonuclease protein n=1 Tax=Monopterus albus TaxID=43700 RepID=UPI0009B3EF18|nr:decapping and exoribonuclease protein [Monopterus albus]XP_020475523.1 decapping and exoribonuclease protein [Monopterus albus]XP_020475524.1 decapping and exoribonuclease protein [Monopterus albus]XP_020475525.1 decapping and exoribonuclease protein [Monopterus albus]
MDRNRPHNPNFSCRKRQSSESEGSGRNQCEKKPFRPDLSHHHQHESGSAPGQSSLPSRGLSTRKELYEREFPLYKQPVEIGCFSLDSERRFFNDSRQLRYYVEPDKNPTFDLRDGYKDRYIKRDENLMEKLDHILRWIMANRSKLNLRASSRALDVDFVTWRGHLTKLLTTPYETREGWLLAVTRFKGTFYISEVETEANHMERENRTERHKEMMYWGYKFEQYTCTDNIHSLPDPGGVVNTNEAFCTVVQTWLADHRLLFSGEVDCRDKDPSAPAPPACYVELKTSAEIYTPKQRSSFHRFKLLKWWAQSFLPGVPRVVAGFRDHEGVVVSVETFHVSKISQLIKSEYNCWKPTVCMNFCSDFLSFVKHVATEDSPSVVYLFSWQPHRDVTYSIHRDSKYSFLPHWYVKEMTSNQDSHHRS